MITITADLSAFKALAERFPKQASRAMERALDKTAFGVRDALKDALPRIFDRPTRWTMNAFQVTPTQNHNMMARVWFKDPPMSAGGLHHYLLPEIEGGPRKVKAFERKLNDKYFGRGTQFVPGKGGKAVKGAMLDAYGNVRPGQITQLLSVLAILDRDKGYQNLSDRSKKWNRTLRDYVAIEDGNRGDLPPGVYERLQTGVGFGYKTKRALPFGAWQPGRKKKDGSVSAVQGKGLRAILIETPGTPKYRARFPFRQMGQAVADRTFRNNFLAEYGKIIGVGK